MVSLRDEFVDLSMIGVLLVVAGHIGDYTVRNLSGWGNFLFHTAVI